MRPHQSWILAERSGNFIQYVLQYTLISWAHGVSIQMLTDVLSHRIKSTVADLQSEVEEALEQVQSALSSTDAVTDRQSSHQQAGPRLVMRDGVHLFDPLATHHRVLAQHGVATTAPGQHPLQCDNNWSYACGMQQASQ